jgi:hypothetical protein
MKKIYDLQHQGLKFKSEFNFDYDLVSHIIELRTKKGYQRIDIIRGRRTGIVYLSKRIVNFKNNIAIFERKGLE